MVTSKEELIGKIEKARVSLNASIDSGEKYEKVYERSVELDRLLEEYMAAGY